MAPADPHEKRTVSIDHFVTRAQSATGSQMLRTDEYLFNNLRPNSVSSYTYGQKRAYSPIHLDHQGSRLGSAIAGGPTRKSASASYHQRPYLTVESSKLPPVPRGSSSADIRNSREILNLFDQIETVETEALKSEANDSQPNSHKEASSNPKVREKKKKKENKKLKKKRKSKDSGDFDKIEEIRIVKRAVSAFKRRKRGGGSKEGEKKTEAFKMETVADRVMKMRIQSGGLEKKDSAVATNPSSVTSMSNGTLIEGVKEKTSRRGSETSSSASL